MNRATLYLLIPSFSLLIWLGVAHYMASQKEQLEKSYHTRSQLLARYHHLQSKWSAKAQKEAIKRFDTLLRLYHIQPQITKQRNKKIYTFILDREKAETILNKLLNSNLAIDRFTIERKDDQHLSVTIGVTL